MTSESLDEFCELQVDTVSLSPTYILNNGNNKKIKYPKKLISPEFSSGLYWDTKQFKFNLLNLRKFSVSHFWLVIFKVIQIWKTWP